MLLALMVCSMNAWSYRLTNTYTIEAKFKINVISAGLIFAGASGTQGNFYMWQFNVGADGTQSLFRPHHWNPGALLDEKGTGDVRLNTSDWFVTTIEVTDGNVARTYLRKDGSDIDVLIDERSGDFAYGLVGARQDHDFNLNESSTFDYIRITDENGDVLYAEEFNETDGNWSNDPLWDAENGTLTVEGRNLSERRYFPNNMFKDVVDMHYTVEADLTIESGFISIIFGLTESGSNYMWQISPNYRNDGSANTYYHLDRGNESWKAHAAGPNYPDFSADDFWGIKHHIMIEVEGNVVSTYIDGKLQETFVQNDMTDLELLNPGRIGLRADGSNGIQHRGYVDNFKLTEYDTDGNPIIVTNETFDSGKAQYIDMDDVDPNYASIVPVDGGHALLIDCDGTMDDNAKVRMIFEAKKTGIGSVRSESEPEAIYNLSGARVSKATSGIYITGGKKFIVK